MKTVATLREALRNPEAYSGWLYLKEGGWTLDSVGVFYLADRELSPEEEVGVREKLQQEGWISTLSREDIEDVIENVREQIENPTEEQLLRSVRFFYENDAYMDWLANN